MKLSVVIPVYNEESTISEVIDKVRAVKLPIDKEIIVVDDGCTNGTVETLEQKQEDVTYVQELIWKELTTKLGTRVNVHQEQAFSSEFLSLLALQAAIPILVSLISGGLYDLLKEKGCPNVNPDDRQMIVNVFINQQVHPNAPLSVDSFATLRRQLQPLGFTNDEIAALYHKVQEGLAQRKAQ